MVSFTEPEFHLHLLALGLDLFGFNRAKINLCLILPILHLVASLSPFRSSLPTDGVYVRIQSSPMNHLVKVL